MTSEFRRLHIAGQGMVPLAYLFVVLVCFAMVFYDGVEGGRWNLSTEEDLEFERQVKVLNKPSIKTIRTNSGVTFDCVEFYKQPAFDYALMNNYTIEYEKPKSLHNKLKDPLHIGIKGDGCPIGTVPIKRITKEDLIREKLASQERTLVSNVLIGAHYAVARTKPTINKFVGAGGAPSIWNPQVSVNQYSAARLKISNQGDSIEVGWRVDPTLYGDSDTHIYVRTDAGRSHCFDTRCGFVIVATSTIVGDSMEPSHREGQVYDMTAFIVQDTINGNWYLEFGKDHKQIGFWPNRLFTGLATLGASAEWGGEVFSPPGTPKPAMGAGSIPSTLNVTYDAYFRIMSLLDGQKTLIADNLDFINDSNDYQAREFGISKIPAWGHVMCYGGSRNSLA